MTQSEVIVSVHDRLKRLGLKAANPDQSYAMFSLISDCMKTCEWKGFSIEDSLLMARVAAYDMYGADNAQDS